ncbi:uncharacterized protein Z520_10112 [Fonsecaea multimorphosa CBS 102226]|uniref:Major facilitator superfamily (MFS) profile domain-containing protein n=1 Tax=Fonsecaea multimorphosa CBS 102226 TaxID=1442371 RepID=A0A0D2IAA9_9EURO|nr:uncharacterized protein Z520_10112 [Fonsecaea multimorphosa CBS 102226]KIX94086.1 hypothetical protein Z520_10112 [Fonsecaea multimorphosa CBS 102226]OAL19439.1 hypothetical protein AYO22_09601 [Fonsecaea multimorphosa]
MSDIHGRKIPMIVSSFGFICFGAGSATAKDFQTLALCRFFQGAMGACALMIPLSSYADFWKGARRGCASILFMTSVFGAPMLASPLAGFTIDNPSLGWRWCAWWTVFMGSGVLFGLVFFASESYAPYLLKQKAVRLRVNTGDWAIHAKIEERHETLGQILQYLFQRPFIMVSKEPILLFICIYVAFVYALIYTFLVSYGIVFVEGYHMNRGTGGLPFFGVIGGLMLSAAIHMLRERHYTHKVMANSGIMVPEWRMPICITGAVSFAVGLFWFAWTAAYPRHVHWIIPTVSGVATGFGILTIFIGCFNFILDVYGTNSVSAFAIATISRSALAAGFPMFAKQMFHNLGVQWANTLLACFATLLVPIPICFWLWGAQIRARSTFAVDKVLLPNLGGGEESHDDTSENKDIERAGVEMEQAVDPSPGAQGRAEVGLEMNYMAPTHQS